MIRTFPQKLRLKLPILLGTVLLLNACATKEELIDPLPFVPRIGGDAEVVTNSTQDELRRKTLIATNLVAALVQVPELRPAAVTLQINPPTSVFGNVLVRALEDAGYGLQRVVADQGRLFVSYGERFAVTESGPVTDFTVEIGPVSVSREYSREGENVYPSSLMSVEGTVARRVDVALADEVFREQGDAGAAFISGVSGSPGAGDGSDVKTVAVREFDAVPLDRRSSLETVLARVRALELERESELPRPGLEDFERYRRTVLLFDDPRTQRLGPANKRAVGLMTREFLPGDLLEIRACHDADGRNDAAGIQAIRVADELASHGVPPGSSRIAPCIRATYRHTSDDSATPVELIHYRPKEGASDDIAPG